MRHGEGAKDETRHPVLHAIAATHKTPQGVAVAPPLHRNGEGLGVRLPFVLAGRRACGRFRGLSRLQLLQVTLVILPAL
jgi:hypothetical protein